VFSSFVYSMKELDVNMYLVAPQLTYSWTDILHYLKTATFCPSNKEACWSTSEGDADSCPYTQCRAGVLEWVAYRIKYACLSCVYAYIYVCGTLYRSC
jgi:hypothetical protein